MTAGRISLRTRKHTDALLDWVKEKGRIVIIIHDNPDPDCLASAMALRQLFLAKLKKEAVITFSGMIGRSENLAMAKAMNLALSPLGIVDLSQFEVICMLDTQPGTGNNSLPPEYAVDILIDHHPLRHASRQCRWLDVRDGYGATATIVYEYLLAQEVPIGPKLATAIFYAIKSETQDLGREANRPDKKAYLTLFPLANKQLLYEITQPKLPIEYFLTISRALDHTRIYGHLLVADLRGVIFPEIVAEMADFLLRLEEIDTVLSMGLYNREMILSLRTTRHELNAGEIIRRLVAGMGTAGGHGMMAGGKIERIPADARGMREVRKKLTDRLLAELGLGETPAAKLVP